MLLQDAKELLAEEGLGVRLGLPNVHDAPAIFNWPADVEERSWGELAVGRNLKMQVVILLFGTAVELQQLGHRHGDLPWPRTAPAV